MQMNYKTIIGFIFILSVLFTGCAQSNMVDNNSSSVAEIYEVANDTFNETEQTTSDVDVESDEVITCYFDELALNAIDKMGVEQNDTDFVKIEKAFIYIIENTEIIEFENAALTNTWRAFCTCDTAPDFYKEMSTGLFEYGLASCENYASAMVLLLEHMGIEAKYVPGLTYSVYGDFMAHAWTMVKVDDVWYHLDAHLEDNISKTSINFKYYMKDDATFAASHAWGDLLLYPSEYSLNLPACDGIIQAPQAHLINNAQQKFTLQEAVDIANKHKLDAGENYNNIPSQSLPSFPVTNQIK